MEGCSWLPTADGASELFNMADTVLMDLWLKEIQANWCLCKKVGFLVTSLEESKQP